MAKSDLQSVDDYIGSQPEAMQEMLRLVRNTIRRAIPEAQETISYNMPTYTLNGDPLLNFAGWKQHYSIYAATEKVVAAFQDELASCRVEKGTIRFPLSKPRPAELIERITKFRAREVAERKNDNSTHPLENPTPLKDFTQIIAVGRENQEKW